MAGSGSRWLRRAHGAAIVLGVTLGLLVLIEVGVRLLLPQTVRTVYEGGASLGVADEFLGHRFRPNSRATVTGPEFSVVYETNEDGLRDRTPHPRPGLPGVHRVLVLGDSFTFGVGSNYEEIWPVLFERRLVASGYPVEVVKAGVPAYDTTKEALLLERLFPQCRPDVVVLGFLPNDLFTNRPIGEGKGAPAEEVATVRAERDRPFELHAAILARRLALSSDGAYARLYRMSPRGRYFSVPMDERLQRQVEVTRQLLARMDDFCRRNAATFVALSIPQLFQVIVAANELDHRGIDVELIDRTFATFAEQRGFPWISVLAPLVEAYRAERDDLYFRLDGHLTARGNRVVADRFSDAFKAVLDSRVVAEARPDVVPRIAR